MNSPPMNHTYLSLLNQREREFSNIAKMWWCEYSNNNAVACTQYPKCTQRLPPSLTHKRSAEEGVVLCGSRQTSPTPWPQFTSRCRQPVGSVLWIHLLMDGKDSLRGKFGRLMALHPLALRQTIPRSPALRKLSGSNSDRASSLPSNGLSSGGCKSAHLLGVQTSRSLRRTWSIYGN